MIKSYFEAPEALLTKAVGWSPLPIALPKRAW